METDPTASRGIPARPSPGLVVGSLCWRELKRFFRQPNRVLGAIGQPLVFWILFGAGLGPTFRLASSDTSVRYAEYFFPGTVVLILLFTAIFTTISVIEDRREGFMQSVLVAPIPRWAMVLGKLLGGTLIASFQGLLMLGLGIGLAQSLDFQFHLSVGDALAAAVLLFLLALALTGLGFVLAWRMDSTQGFHAVMSLFLMPMWLLSGAFFPAETGLLGFIVRINPLTYGVAGLRHLLYGRLPEGLVLPSPALCWLVTLGFVLVTFAASCLVARQRTTGDLL